MAGIDRFASQKLVKVGIQSAARKDSERFQAGYVAIRLILAGNSRKSNNHFSNIDIPEGFLKDSEIIQEKSCSPPEFVRPRGQIQGVANNAGPLFNT